MAGHGHFVGLIQGKPRMPIAFGNRPAYLLLLLALWRYMWRDTPLAMVRWLYDWHRCLSARRRRYVACPRQTREGYEYEHEKEAEDEPCEYPFVLLEPRSISTATMWARFGSRAHRLFTIATGSQCHGNLPCVLLETRFRVGQQAVL